MECISLLRISAVSLLALLSGCYPWPHDYVRTQEFSGLLLKQGAPMAGVSVLVAQNNTDDCSRAKAVAVTDGYGGFRIPSRVERHLFMSILNPPRLVFQETSICFEAHGKRQLGANFVSPTDRTVRYDAVCEWTSPGVDFNPGLVKEPGGRGICIRQ